MSLRQLSTKIPPNRDSQMSPDGAGLLGIRWDMEVVKSMGSGGKAITRSNLGLSTGEAWGLLTNDFPESIFSSAKRGRGLTDTPAGTS